MSSERKATAIAKKRFSTIGWIQLSDLFEILFTNAEERAEAQMLFLRTTCACAGCSLQFTSRTALIVVESDGQLYLVHQRHFADLSEQDFTAVKTIGPKHVEGLIALLTPVGALV